MIMKMILGDNQIGIYFYFPPLKKFMYVFEEIKAIQNHILLRVKFITTMFYTILKKMLFGAI